ncbi:MAG TPA: PAS domain S-box protein [Chloroflexia bacterium]|nr:PAS domain S-box protein [Chloroflexia bacterium]
MQEIAHTDTRPNGHSPSMGVPVRVLLIANCPDDLDLIGGSLDKARRLRPELVGANGLAEGVALLASSKFDAVLLDLALLQEAGVDALRAVQACAPEVPFIALAGDHDGSLEALAAGTQDYLVKDEISAGLLERSLLYALERARSEALLSKKAEVEMRLSEERFRTLFEQSPLPTAILARDGRALQANQAFAELLSVSPERLASYNVYEDAQLQQAGHVPHIRKVFEGETTDLPLFEYEGPGGKRWLRNFAYPIKDETGEVREVVFMGEDITEQKRAEQRLRENEEQYRRVFEVTTDGLVINDVNGGVVEVNAAFCQMHGYTREELIRMSPAEFIHPGSHNLLREFFETVSRGEKFQCQAQDVRKDGTVFDVEVHGATFMYKGEPHVLGVVRDITERVDSERLLKLKEEQYRAVFETTTDGLAIADLNMGTIVEVNPAFARMHGYTREEMAGMLPTDFVHPADYEVQAEFVEKARVGERAYAQGQDVRKDGSVFSIEVHGVPFSHNNQPHVLAIMRDITERLQAEKLLRDSEEQYRGIFEATTDGLVISTIEPDGNAGVLVDVNPAFCEMHGFTREELIGQHPSIFVNPDNLEELADCFKIVQAGGEFHSVGLDRRKDGTTFDVEVNASRFTYKGQPLVLGVIRNITEQKLAEQRLRESEEQYRGVFEATTDGLVITSIQEGDSAAYIVDANPAFCEMHGRTREELIGQHPTVFIHPSGYDGMIEAFEAIKAGKPFAGEGLDVRKDGSAFDVEVHAIRFMHKGESRVLAVIRNVTEQKAAEGRLRESEEQYRGVFESTLDGLVVTALEGEMSVVDANPAFCQMHGFTREELIGKSPAIFVHPNSRAKLAEAMETVLNGGKYLAQAMDVRKDGSEFHVEVHLTRFTRGDKVHSLGVVRDITERVQAYELLEQRVEERTRELSTLLEVSSNVNSTLELKPLLGRVLDQLKSVVDYAGAGILLVDGDELVMLDSRDADGPEPEMIGRRYQISRIPLVWKAISEQGWLAIPDVRAEDGIAREYQTAVGAEVLNTSLSYINSYLGVRLMLKDKVIGHLTLSHWQPNYYTRDHARLATGLANQAAIAIENARLYEQAQETTRRTATLARIASRVALGGPLRPTLDDLSTSVVGATGALACAIGVFDDKSGLLKLHGTCNLPDGYAEGLDRILASGTKLLAQAAFEGRKPMVLHNMRRSVLDIPAYEPIHKFMHAVPWDTVVAVPMIYQDKPMGVLLKYHLPGREFGDEQMGFFVAIADQIAVAVANGRLFEQVQGKAALEERQRLARELHDSVTQELFSISLTSRSIQLLLEREGVTLPSITEKMADLRQLTQGALAEMRALIFELRPGALEEEGLLQALRKHAAAVQGREMLPVEVIADEASIPRLKPNAEESLYRIGQEALHNVVKHAHAKRVQIKMDVEDGVLALQICDDGDGFDASQVPAGHMGLNTMGQRVAALGGEYHVSSKPGEGTTVSVRLPVASQRLQS